MRALLGATLIDGSGAPPLADAAVLVEGERIAAAGPRSAVPVPAEAEIADLTGCTLLPGLIDCHDHFAFGAYSLMDVWGLDAPASARHLRTASILRRTLESGYTTVRDAAWLDLGFKQAIAAGDIVGPRLVLAVNIITPTGGIGDATSPAGHGRMHPADPMLPDGVADGADAARAAVRRMVRAGADVIKCATTGGASSRVGHGPLDPVFTLEEMRALVEEAHAHGRPVMCHAIGGPGLRLAIEAGVDSVDHGAYLDDDPGLVEQMAAQGTFFVPTLTVYTFHRDRGAPHVQARAREMQPHEQASIRLALEAGVKIVAGTDAGGYAHNINARELALLVEAGLSPMQAIQAATGRAAECLQLADEIGTVETGKRADLAAFRGDPLADITILEREQPVLVLQDGEVRVG